MSTQKALGTLGPRFGVGLKHFLRALGRPQPNAFRTYRKAFVCRQPNGPNAFFRGNGGREHRRLIPPIGNSGRRSGLLTVPGEVGVKSLPQLTLLCSAATRAPN